jgi:hypothetical protein
MAQRISPAASALVIAFGLLGQPAAGQNKARLPAQLDEYVARVAKLSDAQRAQLLAGKPVTRIVDADPSNEVAVFGAIWVDAPASRYVELIQNIEQFEKGSNFLITQRLSSPPRADDFAGMRLTDEDVADLRTCRVGRCELKLSEDALKRARSEIDWSKPNAKAQAEALARRLAFEYVMGYLEGGDSRLAVYRDSSRPTFVANEFKSMVDRMPSLTEFLPDLKEYLVGFPKVTLAGTQSFLYWQEAKFGLKPTIRINHVVITQRSTHVAVASKMIYANHYFWTALELRVLVPDPARGQGFWFVSINRSRSDGLTGFTGRLIRGKVRGEAEEAMVSALNVTKARVEAK